MNMAPNTKYPGASRTSFYLAPSPICVNDAGEVVGDGMFAGEDFAAGSHIFALKRPLVAALDAERLQDSCANCFAWTAGSAGSAVTSQLESDGPDLKVKACTGCKGVKYCGTACQKQAWSRVHKHECKLIQGMAGREVPKAVRATMEILIRRKHELFTDMQWRLLCGLPSHIDDFKRADNYADIQLMAMGARSFSQSKFPLDFVEAMLTRVMSNSSTLVTPTFEPLGIFIDEYFSQLNHSCDPNAYIVMDGPEIALRALKPIKKDEEVYISYIDTTNPYARRQTELKAGWFFDCKCSRCQHGPTLDADKWKVEPKELTFKWEQTGDTQPADELATAPENYVGDSNDEKRVAAIQAAAFAMYEDAQKMSDPTQSIKMIEDGMRTCYQSELWPVYRQPYAALRDALIVKMLCVGNYDIAWAHCAKRYKYILPKLYPQQHHPVRVVQVWQMAMLAWYLSGGEKPTYPGVDMGLIALMLINEVNTSCKLSHGENHSFSKTVQKKFDEASAEFREKVGGQWGPEGDRIVQQHREILLKMGDRMQY